MNRILSFWKFIKVKGVKWVDLFARKCIGIKQKTLQKLFITIITYFSIFKYEAN